MIERGRAIEGDGRTVAVGMGLAVVTALVSGVSVFLNASAVRSVGDPVLFTTLKNGVAAMMLVAVAATVAPRGATLRDLDRPSVGGLVVLGVIGGSIPFVLFFTGLASASAPAAAVIHKTLFAWVALLAVVFLRERLGILQVAALAVLMGSQLLIQPPDGITWTSGEAMIAIATAMWAVEVIVAKRVLTHVPSPVAAAARMGIGLLLLVAYLVAGGGLAGVGELGAEQWAWVLGTGLLLTAYVSTWYAALRRAPATAVTAVLTLSVPLTAALQLVTSGQLPPSPVVGGYAGTLLAAGVIAWLTLRRHAPRPAAATA